MLKPKNLRPFFKGAARVADIFGDLDRHLSFETNDAKAVRSDWKEVGIDIQEAIDGYGSRKERQPV